MRILQFIPAIAWMAWIYWLSSQQALPPPPGLSYTLVAIGGHFALYLVLTILLLLPLGLPGRIDTRSAIAMAIVAAAYAVSDEYHQSHVPGRDASVLDLLVDSTGILVAVVVWTYGWRKIAIS